MSDPAVGGIVGQECPAAPDSSTSSATGSAARAAALGCGLLPSGRTRRRKRPFKGENADSQAGSRSTPLSGLVAAHVAIDIPEELLSQRIQPSVESRQRAHRKTGIQRRALKNRGGLRTGDVAFYGAQHPKERGQTVYTSGCPRIGQVSPVRYVQGSASPHALKPHQRVGHRLGILARQNPFNECAE